MLTKSKSLADVPTDVQPFVVNGTKNEYFQYQGEWNVSSHVGGGESSLAGVILTKQVEDRRPSRTNTFLGLGWETPRLAFSSTSRETVLC